VLLNLRRGSDSLERTLLSPQRQPPHRRGRANGARLPECRSNPTVRIRGIPFPSGTAAASENGGWYSLAGFFSVHFMPCILRQISRHYAAGGALLACVVLTGGASACAPTDAANQPSAREPHSLDSVSSGRDDSNRRATRSVRAPRPASRNRSDVPPAAVDDSSPIRPDRALTPGATFPVSAADICVSGYARSVRNVPVATKRAVYAEYGIRSHEAGAFEVDHLISLELGGSNSIKNLWPESFRTAPWNAYVKDALENRLHNEVCAGQLSLDSAQKEIATDWIAAYKTHFHRNAPLAPRRRQTPPRKSQP
jgi:hypothetical protein